MGCFSEDPPAPVNYGQVTSDTLKSQIQLAPELYSAESNSNYGQPAYTKLSLQDLAATLNGSPGGTQSSTTNTVTPGGWYDASGKMVSGDTNYYNSVAGATTARPAASFGVPGPNVTTGTNAAPALTWRSPSTTPTTTTTTSPATPGLNSLLAQASTSQRTSDVNDVATLGPQATQAILASDPYNQELLGKLNAQANQGLDAGSGLTPDQIRAMQQSSRAAFAARGMGGGNASIADEILKQFNLGQQLLTQRQQFAQSVVGNNQAVLGDPWQAILGRPSSATQQAQGVNQASGSTLFNPQSSEAASIAAGNQGYAAQFAAPSVLSDVTAVGKGVGSIAGSFAGAMI